MTLFATTTYEIACKCGHTHHVNIANLQTDSFVLCPSCMAKLPIKALLDLAADMRRRAALKSHNQEIDRMKALYIAGPFRGAHAYEITQNVNRAEAVAIKVCRLGFLAVCPHTMYRNFQGAMPDSFWLAASMQLLKRCDGIVLINNWENSAGSCSEYAWADENGLLVFTERNVDEGLLGLSNSEQT